MTFLYPRSRQFPMDEVCEQIVCELAKRDWKVPGIRVKFDNYGRDFAMVSTIEGENFRLWFCRVQGRLAGNWNDTAAINQINIPKKELSVYEDESGPTLYLYVGKNWKKDEQNFVHGSKVNSKLSREPRTYLRYTGSNSTTERYRYRGRRPSYLIHDNDLGREYDPKNGEPTSFVTSDVMQEFTEWLRDNVLAYIMSY